MMFITLEGGEGSGKTTVITELEKRLIKKGKKVLISREPGGVKIAEEIRNIILDSSNNNMDPVTETLLYAASRRQHIVEKFKNANVDYIICDRFIDSSVVYQGLARDVGIENVYKINSFAIGNFMPNKTFLLDINPEIGLNRIKTNRTTEINRFDNEKIDFHIKVRQGYLKIAEMNEDRIKIINAENTVTNVVNKIMEELVE